MIALGALVSKTKIVSEDKAMLLLEEFFGGKKDLLELNKKALQKGLEFNK